MQDWGPAFAASGVHGAVELVASSAPWIAGGCCHACGTCIAWPASAAGTACQGGAYPALPWQGASHGHWTHTAPVIAGARRRTSSASGGREPAAAGKSMHGPAQPARCWPAGLHAQQRLTEQGTWLVSVEVELVVPRSGCGGTLQLRMPSIQARTALRSRCMSAVPVHAKQHTAVNTAAMHGRCCCACMLPTAVIGGGGWPGLLTARAGVAACANAASRHAPAQVHDAVEVTFESPGDEFVTHALEVHADLVQLWWPVGYGSQPLYELTGGCAPAEP